MDDPELDGDAHHSALRALSRVHRISRCGARFRDFLTRTLPESTEPVRVLDLACGGGDLSLDIARWARRTGTPVAVTGVDLSARALGFAGERAEAEGLSIEWVEADVLTDLPTGPFDLIVSSLFLHHLAEEEVVALLRTAAERTKHLVVEDLRRSPLGFALAWAGLRLLSRAHVTHVDGPRSVRAAWRREEFHQLAARAGLEGARIRRAWPERLVLTWSRS